MHFSHFKVQNRSGIFFSSKEGKGRNSIGGKKEGKGESLKGKEKEGKRKEL